MVVQLMKYGADPSLIDGEGCSCVHLAAQFGHTSIVAYLIAKGQVGKANNAVYLTGGNFHLAVHKQSTNVAHWQEIFHMIAGVYWDILEDGGNC